VQVLFRKEHGDFREMALQAFQGYLYVLVTALVFLLPADDTRWQAPRLRVHQRGHARARGDPAAGVPPGAQGAGRRDGEPRCASPRRSWPSGLGLLAAVEGLTEAAPSGITLLAPHPAHAHVGHAHGWDLLEYVGKASKGDTDAAAG